MKNKNMLVIGCLGIVLFIILFICSISTLVYILNKNNSDENDTRDQDKYLTEIDEKYLSNKIKSIESSDFYIYLSKNVYSKGETINYSIQNNTNKESNLDTFIFRNDNGKWKTVGIVDCPCGAMCDMAWLTIQPKEKVDFTWNQNAEWCEGRNMMNSNYLDKTIKREVNVPTGKYGIAFRETLDNGNKYNLYYIEFEIK
jgi:hypothetical protein